MEGNPILEILFMGFGALIFGAAVFNWEYFFKMRKASMLANAIGLKGARIVYALLGLFFAIFGANQFFDLQLF